MEKECKDEMKAGIIAHDTLDAIMNAVIEKSVAKKEAETLVMGEAVLWTLREEKRWQYSI